MPDKLYEHHGDSFGVYMSHKVKKLRIQQGEYIAYVLSSVKLEKLIAFKL